MTLIHKISAALPAETSIFSNETDEEAYLEACCMLLSVLGQRALTKFRLDLRATELTPNETEIVSQDLDTARQKIASRPVNWQLLLTQVSSATIRTIQSAIGRDATWSDLWEYVGTGENNAK